MAGSAIVNGFPARSVMDAAPPKSRPRVPLIPAMSPPEMMTSYVEAVISLTVIRAPAGPATAKPAGSTF